MCLGSSLVEQQHCKLEKGVDWASFRECLAKKHSRGHAKGVFNYAMKYVDCLLNEDFSELCGLSVEKRRNILTVLSNLSKFLGKT